MRRVFWLAMGVTAGAVVARKVTRTLDALTPQSIAGSIAEGLAILGEGVRDFVDDVRDGMSERERVLQSSLGLPDAQGRPLLYVPPASLEPGAPDAGTGAPDGTRRTRRRALDGTDPQERDR